MNINFEQFLSKFDPGEWEAKAIANFGISTFLTGWLAFHPRGTLRLLKSEGMSGMFRTCNAYRRNAVKFLMENI